MMGKGQFVMETSGFCFLCLKLRSTTKTSVFDREGRNVQKVFSLHNICQYLKLNLRDVVAGTISLLPGAASALEGSELKGSLCEECGHLSETFSSYFLELEVIQMKLQFLIKSIYKKMVEIEREGEGIMLKEFKREMLRRPETLAQYGIVEQLRRKTMERCFRRLSASQPRVIVEKMSSPTVSSISGGIKMECCPDMDLILNQSRHEIDYLIQSHNFPPTHTDVEAEPNSCLVECDICHLKVSDLFGHISTAHSETHGDTNLETSWGIPGLPSFGIPPPYKVFKNIEKVNKKSDKFRRHHCDLCGKDFAQSGTLSRHRRLVHFAKMLKGSEKIKLGFHSNLPQVSSIMEDPINVGESELLVHPSFHPATRTAFQNSQMEQGVQRKMDQSSSNLFAQSTATPANSSNDFMQPQSTFNPETGQHTCNLCFKVFKNHPSFILHHRIVHLKIRYECTICGKEFERRGCYNRHHKDVHGPGGPRHYTCHKCSSTFKNKIGLIKHQRKVSCGNQKKKKHDTVCRCHECGKEFTRLDSLRIHFRAVHLKLREHVCNLCGKGFSQKGYLALHRCVAPSSSKLIPTHDDPIVIVPGT